MPNEYLNNKIFESIIAKFQESKQDKFRYEMILDDLRGEPTRQPGPARLLGQKTGEYELARRTFSDSQDQLATAFYTLSENIVRYAKFHLIDEQDAIQEGVMICFEKIDRFDPVKGKAFNYMTTCILNHYRQLYRTARNYNELKRKYHDYLWHQVARTLAGPRKLPLTNKDKFT